MRLPRFETFLAQLIREADSPFTAVATFGEEGIEDPPCGLVLTASHGGQLGLQFVRTSPDGGENFAEPERITEAEVALDPVEVPYLALRNGQLHVADVDAWLRALLINSGSRELVYVGLVSDNPGYYHRQGLRLRFHNGAAIYCMWRLARPAGARRPPAEPFNVSEAI